VIKPYIYAAVLAVIVAALAFVGTKIHKAGADGVMLEWAAANVAAEETQRLRASAQAKANEGVDRATVARQSAARAAAAADRAALDSLRDAITSIPAATADTTTTSCADERRTISVLAGLVLESADLLAEGKERGTELATQAAGLREYVSTVCAMPVTIAQ
jgi:hypothetical protein